MNFKVYVNQAEEEHFRFSVTSPQELKHRIERAGLLNSTFVIRNEKGEPCNANLEVIPSHITSMESMVGLLQSKFSSKKRN